MAMSDDIASHSLEMATNVSRTTLELVKYLVSSLKNVSDELKHFFNQSDNFALKGKVNNNKFLELAKNSGGYKQQAGISQNDIGAIISQAKTMGIPINVRDTGNGQCAVCYLNRDKALFKTCISNVVANKLETKDTDYLAFKVTPQEMSAFKKEFESFGVKADFIETKDGSLKCVYEARDKSSLDIIKRNYQDKHKMIADNFEVKYDELNRNFKLRDKSTNKTISMSKLPTEAKLNTILQERFGYDKTTAIIACDNFASKLSSEQKNYYKTDTYQLEKLSNLEHDIKIDNESPLLEDFSFSRIKSRNDNHNHFAVSNGDHVVHITPDTMSKRDMEEIVKTKLGITDKTTIQAVVDKASYANTKYKEKDLSVRKNITQAFTDNKELVGIERVSKNEFELTQNGKIKRYSFANAKETLIANGLTRQKATEIVEKAKRQSSASNMFKRLEKSGVINNKGISPNIPKVDIKPKVVGR